VGRAGAEGGARYAGSRGSEGLSPYLEKSWVGWAVDADRRDRGAPGRTDSAGTARLPLVVRIGVTPGI